MSEKKTLHIIPHSHWDREWYLPFETHRTRLVKLFDTLIELMEKNPDYTYYHMDGQFVVIEDYLEIRPQMKDRLLALIKADRIQIGPWYILQDEYLTSGEANVRNMLYGIKLCKNFGADPVMSGYFPDAFGNISQAPQILRGFDIDNAIFGRGLNDMGADNVVVKQNGITKSEMLWQSPDGSEVIGIMFANWYCNAMELPTDKEALAAKLENVINGAERVIVNLAEHFHKNGYRVVIVTTRKAENEYEVSEGIERRISEPAEEELQKGRIGNFKARGTNNMQGGTCYCAGAADVARILWNLGLV